MSTVIGELPNSPYIIKEGVDLLRLNIIQSQKVVVVVVVVMLFYVHGKHLRSCRDGQLT